MNDQQFDELKTKLASIEGRLKYLEVKLAVPAHETQPELDITPLKPLLQEKATTSPPPLPQPVRRKRPEPTNLLGVLGVGCLILAMILLIRFSIDSGWLTPFRQVMMAGVFGLGLIVTPFFLTSKDRSYLSLLPAAGVVVLHLSVYGATFYHELLNPRQGIFGVWAISSLSLVLLAKFEEDLYAILAIAGTYMGSYLLRDSFDHYSQVAMHIIIWDIVFASFAIFLRNRTLICIAAYFSLGLVSVYGFSYSNISSEIAIQQATIQLFQIMIYAVATQVYSIRNNAILSASESWQLFPVFLFFYGQEFYYIDIVNPQAAIGFALGFAFVIFLLSYTAQARLKKKHLESSAAVYTLISLILIHSIYVVLLDDLKKMISTAALLVVLPLFRHQLKDKEFQGAMILTGLSIAYSLLLVLFNAPELPRNTVMLVGFVYAVLFFIGYGTTRTALLIAMANVLAVVSICRLDQVLGESWVAPLCVAYAFGCLIFALRWSDKILAQASLPVIFVAVGRFSFMHYSELTAGERIISLVVMGALIYMGGFIYRKVPQQ